MSSTKYYQLVAWLGIAGLIMASFAPDNVAGLWWAIIALVVTIVHGMSLNLYLPGWKLFLPAGIATTALFAVIGLHSYGVIVLSALQQVAVILSFLLIPGYLFLFGMFAAVYTHNQEQRCLLHE